MVFFGELGRKFDTTKVHVTGGDLPKGDWIFNGHSLVFAPERGADPSKEKVCVQLADNCTVIARKVEDPDVLKEFGRHKVPLAGAVAGLYVAGPLGLMTGFAASSLLARNVASFECSLSDGRSFTAMADYNIYRRIQSIARK